MAEEQKTQASVRVRYFGKAPGRAQPLRLALALGGIAFEDELVTWDEHKAAKQMNKRRWVGLPELVIYDDAGNEVATIGQSLTQLRYVGTLTGSYPSDVLQRAFVDEILDSTHDLQSALRYNGETDKDKQKAMREALIAKDGKLSYFLNKYVLRLEENEKRGNKNGFIAGDTLTIADITLTTKLTNLTSGFWDYIPKDLFSKNFPALEAYIDRIQTLPGIIDFNTKFTQRLTDFKDETKRQSVKVVTYSGRSLSNASSASKAVCILNADGGSGVSGTVVFEDIGGKTKISVDVKGLSPGKHGFHIHQLGDLSGGCKTAKGHFNPLKRTHGGPKDKERHVGDLGNILADDKGNAVVEIIDELVQLNGAYSIIGRSVVVHKGEDDLGKGGHDDSLTTGHAGSRVACGVIGRGN